MTALAQGSGGLALVLCFALLRTGQASAAAILLVIQSCAVAIAAVALGRPLMAIPPFVLGGGFWLIRHRTPMLDSATVPTAGVNIGMAGGAVLAILCQSQGGGIALPLAIFLLSMVLGATRSDPSMQLVALIVAQNGLSLLACLLAQPAHSVAALLVPACLLLPLPVAAGLLLPAIISSPNRGKPGRTRPWVGLPKLRIPSLSRIGASVGWIDLGVALAMFAATLIVPLDGMASVFAPLFALDGVLRSSIRRNRRALTPLRRGAALAQTGFTVLAVSVPTLMVAWLAVVGVMTTTLPPILSRPRDRAVLAFLAAGLSLFGMQLLGVGPSVLGYFSLFVGFATIAALVPDLAVVLVVIILRVANGAPWPHGVEALGAGIATIALLACAWRLTEYAGSRRAMWLQSSQASIAALAICIGQAEGRFAALVLLILLILTRAAARVTDGPAETLAMAGLAGVPPLGVFPGLVLVVLAMSAYEPWLLVPFSVASIPILVAGMPTRLPDFPLRRAIPSMAWLPLAIAILAGYFAPGDVVHWWRILTAGRP